MQDADRQAIARRARQGVGKRVTRAQLEAARQATLGNRVIVEENLKPATDEEAGIEAEPAAE